MKRKQIIAGLIALLALLAPASAAPIIHAHPALWHVRGPLGEVTLMGSIHLLPPDVDWHTHAVKAAIARADVFVFEVSIQQPAMDRIQDLIRARGLLPPDQSLRALLSPEARGEFDQAVETAHLSPSAVDRERPWLVSLQLLVAESSAKHFNAAAGVDRAVMAQAEAAHKPMRYFENVDQQFALLAPADNGLQLHEFEADLKNFGKDDDDLDRLFHAWATGNVKQLGRLMNEGLSGDVKKALLDDRNKRWALQIETMLREKRRFFITVGAGHLSGPEGVPALLRQAGYKVDGP